MHTFNVDAIFFGAIPTYGVLPYVMIFIVYITTTHEALGALLTAVTVGTTMHCSRKVTSVKGLCLRGNPLRLYRAKH